MLERQLVLRQRADDVEQQPAGDDDGAVALGLRLDRHADAELHVGGLELDASVARAQEDAGEGLDGAAGRDAAHGDAELLQELVT